MTPDRLHVPRWRRWSLVALERRRVARLLDGERESAAARGDGDLAAALAEAVRVATWLVRVEPAEPAGHDAPSSSSAAVGVAAEGAPAQPPGRGPSPARESEAARLVRLLRDEGEDRGGRRWLSRAQLRAFGFDERTLRFTAARARRAGSEVRAEGDGYSLLGSADRGEDR